MGRIASLAALCIGRSSTRELEEACLRPRETQAHALRKILQGAGGTAFARDHGLNGDETLAEFRRKIPIRDFEGLRPYINRAAAGESRVLTSEDPIYFARTSGTTSEPKLIPATEGSAASDSRLTRQWVHRARLDHPAFLSGDIFTVVSSAVEEHTPSGIPIGSASGFIASRIPALVRRSYAVPAALAEITEYHTRYLAMLRLGLERPITHLNTPNPSTLLRLAELGAEHAEDIFRAIREGRLIPGARGNQMPPGDGLRALEMRLRPNPARAAELERMANRRGLLAPRDGWPGLALIACWTGGSVGETAARLEEWYGKVPVRDLGYIASEGRFTIPISDGTAAGLPVLGDKLFEFLPEDAEDGEVLGIEDLEMGARYRMLVTTAAGLYRYDILDVVQVQGFHGRTPLLAFARKGRDMANITGEKLHANHVLGAMAAIALTPGKKVRQFRVAADSDRARYRFYLEPEQMDPDGAEPWGCEWLDALDHCLQDQNLEYRQKRESGRLQAPWLHVMAPGWSEELFRAWVRSGRKDAQYKWQVLAQMPEAAFEEYILETVQTRT